MLTKSKRVLRLVFLPILILAIAVGTYLGVDAANVPHAYVVSYVFAGAWIMAGVVTGIGALFCLPRYTRYAGALVVMAGVLLLASFYATFLVLRETGHVKWNEREPMVDLGPTAKAGLLIYFKSDASRDEIRTFLDRVIFVPEPRGNSLRQGIGRFLRLNSVQGHEGVAVDFTPSTTAEQRRQIMSEVLADRTVYRILSDTVPAEVVNLN